MARNYDPSPVWVCEDCYMAHHYGWRHTDRSPTDDELHDWKGGYLRDGHSLPNFVYSDHDPSGYVVREYFVGESDKPAQTFDAPLERLAGYRLADNTCSNHEQRPCPNCGQADFETGITDFSWSQCDGCGSTLGGARYRLAAWED